MGLFKVLDVKFFSFSLISWHLHTNKKHLSSINKIFILLNVVAAYFGYFSNEEVINVHVTLSPKSVCHQHPNVGLTPWISLWHQHHNLFQIFVLDKKTNGQLPKTSENVQSNLYECCRSIKYKIIEIGFTNSDNETSMLCM